MTTLDERFNQYIELLAAGETVQAIERYYGPEICVFENQKLVRAGRDHCLRYEREQLSMLDQAPVFTVRRSALNAETGVAFLEYTVRFCGRGGRPMRLSEVAVQSWERGCIVEERFYYEGLIDEGDDQVLGEATQQPHEASGVVEPGSSD